MKKQKNINPIALELRLSGKYGKRVVKSRKVYDRKKEKQGAKDLAQ